MGGAWRRGGGFARRGRGLRWVGGVQGGLSDLGTGGGRALDVGGVYFSVPPYLVCAKGMEERGEKTSRRSEPPCRGCLAGET